jgi:glucokinase
MSAQTQPVLAIDVGGTKLAAAILLPDDTLHHRLEMPTLAWEGAEAILSRIIALAGQAIEAYHQATPAALPVAAVGVASAGQIDPAQGQVVLAANLPGWTGLKLGEH